jgi:mono/diheme cytochrome c family protein
MSACFSASALAQDLASRGAYLAAAGNCSACHTADDGRDLAGGRAFVTDYGTIYSTNITPDDETGIGRWSLEDFSIAMRQGLRPGGEHLYPVFPYTSFTKLTDDDIGALYAYLKTVPAVKSEAPANDLGFPFDQRWALGLWKALFFTEGRYEPQPGQSEAWNRGAYLVEGLGHCGECHTPRNALGGMDADLALAGATYLDSVEGKLSAWSASNLTSAQTGLAAWSEDDIAEYLKLGFNHRAGVFGPMNAVIESTRQLTREDVQAMAVYLKSLPAAGEGGGPEPSEDVMRMGSIQYDIHCGTCHLPTGEGSPETGPPLVGSPVTLDSDPASLINITLYGAQLPSTAPSTEWQGRGWKRMEAYASKLSDEQAAALLSYIRHAWGHAAGAVSEAQVAAQR